MIAVIVWKEWRQQVAMLIAILALAGIVLMATAFSMPREWDNRTLHPDNAALWIRLLVGLAVTQGVVTGAMLFAGETEDRTQDFLDQHAGSRWPIWKAKMLSGGSLVGVSSLALGVLMIAMNLGGPLLLAACVWFAFDALIWSAACSVRRKTTFGAIGVAVVTLFFVAVIPLTILSRTESYLGYFAIKIPLAAFALAFSRHRYCAVDRVRVVHPTIFRFALWQLWTRRKGTLAILLAGFGIVAYGTTTSTVPLLFWPVGMFLLGSLAGWAVFADEQSEGAERFLGDRRFPPLRLWLAKTLPLLTIALLGAGLVAAGVFMSTLIAAQSRRQLLPSQLTLLYFFKQSPTAVALPFVFLIQGFGFAAFAGQQMRKMPVAIFLTLTLGGPAALLWYPSLFNGLAAWHALLIPIGLSLATLWLWPRWTSGRLHDRGGMVRLIGVLAAAALWQGGSLWWRVAQIPDPGQPFDATAYLASLRTTPGPHGAELRAASFELQDRLKLAGERFPIGPAFDENGAPVKNSWWETWDYFSYGELSWNSVRWRILCDGPPTRPGEYQDYLDLVFAGEWAERFAKAALAAPDCLQHSQHFPSTQFELIGGPFCNAIDLIMIRSRLHMKEGKTDAAIDDLAIALAAVRHGSNKTWGQVANSSVNAQRGIVAVAGRLMRDPAADAKFRRRLADVLAKHEESLPSFTGIIQSTYLVVLDRRSLLNSSDPVVWASVNAPWERHRVDRQIRQAFAWMMPQGRTNRFETGKASDRIVTSFFGRPADEIAKSSDKFVDDNNLGDIWRFLFVQSNYPDRLMQLRLLRVTLAAELFEADHGRPIQSLAELVPQYLDRLPESPYVGHSIGYRTADGGERDEWTGTLAVAGQGVVYDSSNPNRSFFVSSPAKK